MRGFVGHRGLGAGIRIAAGLAICTAAVALSAQAPLTLYLSATDASGKAVGDLKAEEITMSENGQAGKITAAEKFSLPMHLTIGLDNGPGSSQSLGFYRNGLAGLVNALPNDVEVTVISMAPQPRMVVKGTTSHDEVLKGISRVAPDSDGNPARFTDTLVEFTKRLESDNKDKKLNYSPYLLIVSTTAAEVTSYQKGDLDKMGVNFLNFGARLSVAMTTTRASGASGPGASDVQDLNDGRQALIAIPLTKATNGKFEALAQPSALEKILPEWGKMLSGIATKQSNQYKLSIQRPAGATGNLNNLDMRVTRPGVNGAVSGDGRYTQ